MFSTETCHWHYRWCLDIRGIDWCLYVSAEPVTICYKLSPSHECLGSFGSGEGVAGAHSSSPYHKPYRDRAISFITWTARHHHTAACALENCECNQVLCNMAQFLFILVICKIVVCVCVCVCVCGCQNRHLFEILLFILKGMNVQRRRGLEWQAWASCLALLCVGPDKRPSPAWKELCSGGRGDREGEREKKKKAPPWLCWRSVQKREMGVGWNRPTVWKVIKPGD